jgi:hypothetical protein
MIRRIKQSFALIFLFAAFNSIAQEDVPWPPDPMAFFTDAVEVVEVPGPIQLHPIVDNEERVIHIYDWDVNEWREYPFPESMTEAQRYGRAAPRTLPDGQWLIATNLLDGMLPFSKYADPLGYWLLDPQTGIFSRPELACGQLRAPTGAGEWLVEQESADHPAYVCFTETNERVGPLPLLIDDHGRSAWWRHVGTSPNREWVVLYNYTDQRFWGYQPMTERLVAIDNRSDTLMSQYFSISDWLDNTYFLVFADDLPTWSNRGLYGGDVSVENSFQPIIESVNYPTYYDDPPRYELIPGLWGDGIGWRGTGNSPDCILKVYYLETRTLEDYPLGKYCEPNLIIPQRDGARLYRYVNLDRSNPAQLIALKPQTGELEILYEGEVEIVYEISPDGRYVVLAVDDNGEIDILPDSWAGGGTWFAESSKPQIVVFDMLEREFVYRVEENITIDSLGGEPFVEWINDQTLILSGPNTDPYIRVIYLNDADNSMLTIEDGGGYSLSRSRKYMYFYTSQEDTPTIDLIDLETRIIRTILYRNNNYGTSIEWQDGDILSVRISPSGAVSAAFSPPVIEYHVYMTSP